MKEKIREYVDNYVEYYPERWRWELKNSIEQSELYMRTRARRTKSMRENADLLPDFYSIERDANQFGLKQVQWTDFFGLVWEGTKGVHRYVGAPDYKGSLYYYDEEEESYGETGYSVSEKYDAYENQPSDDVYTKVVWHGTNHWIDTLDACDAKYTYIVNNHLFKDTHIVLTYEDGEEIIVYADYEALIRGLTRHGKNKLIEKILKAMDEHFIKLRDSDREEIRGYYPGKTAEEMFLRK